jgi:DNA mismatch endonuclease (patch repair protein)
VAVFVDGCFWHGCPAHCRIPSTNVVYWQAKIERNRQRDRANDEQLRSAGWEGLRFWEHLDPVEAAATIEAVVRARRAPPSAEGEEP